MKTKRIKQTGMEVMDSIQLSKINGGKTIYIIVDGKLVPIEVPS